MPWTTGTVGCMVKVAGIFNEKKCSRDDDCVNNWDGQ